MPSLILALLLGIRVGFLFKDFLGILRVLNQTINQILFNIIPADALGLAPLLMVHQQVKCFKKNCTLVDWFNFRETCPLNVFMHSQPKATSLHAKEILA